MNNSRHSIDNSHASHDLVERSTQLLNEIKALINQITMAQKDTEMCVEESQSLLTNGSQYLNDAELAFQVSTLMAPMSAIFILFIHFGVGNGSGVFKTGSSYGHSEAICGQSFG
jgi:hypothetical protein